MKRAIIFGGAFNPPSKGHVWIVSECAKLARQTGAEVWIMPSGERRDKHIGVSKNLRLELCQAMVEDADTEGVFVRILTSELDREELVETIDTVMEFERRYPDYELSWVFGADSFLSMSTWRGGEWMCAHLDFILVTRNGYPVESRQRVRIIEGVHGDVSSTQIRQAHSRRRSFSQYVTPQVRQLLETADIRYTNEQ